MAPQKQHAVLVTTLDEKKAEAFDNFEFADTDVPKLQNGQVRTVLAGPKAVNK